MKVKLEGFNQNKFSYLNDKQMTEPKFEAFALIELFGHSRMAGKVTEQSIGGSSFIRVDVPETPKSPAFTRILNPSSIYAINPVTEEVVNELAVRIQSVPIQEWDIREVVAKAKKALDFPKPESVREEENYYGGDDYEDEKPY